MYMGYGFIVNTCNSQTLYLLLFVYIPFRRPLIYTSINSDSQESLRNAAVVNRYKYYSRLAAYTDTPMVSFW